MSKATLARLSVLAAALAACADGATTRTLTAPDIAPTFDAASADIGFATTADGPFDVIFGTDDPSAELSAASAAAAAAARQSSPDGRASGHVGFNFGVPTVGLLSERYSFTSLGSESAPTFAAKGQFELMLTAATGVEQRFHGDVICMSVVGNTARIAGQLTKVWINNVQRPITGATHVIWTVQDNGEGQGATDIASPMFFNNAANAQFHCSTGFLPPTFPNQDGNVQVQP